MNQLLKKIYMWLHLPILLPHLFLYYISDSRAHIDADVQRNSSTGGGKTVKLISLLVFVKEFRNLFYYRIGPMSILLRYLPRLSTLYINVGRGRIGPGLVIQHGFATVITAESIGSNCWINQQVTIGFNDSRKYGYGKPIIGDNVRVSCGAKVVGKIRIGNDSTIGVNAVVVKDVPAGSTIVPSPMLKIRENGEKTYKQF